MAKKIEVKYGSISKLSEELNLSTKHVKACLNGVVNSDKAEEVRIAAYEKGYVMKR